MGKRVLVGVGAGLVTVALVVGIATVAYRAGRAEDARRVVVRDGEAVRVVDHAWDRGPGFGFLVFPLLVTGLIVLAVSRRSGPGPAWGCTPGPEAAFAEWHRRAHGQQAPPPA